MGVPLELLGASGLSTLWSAVTTTSTEERLETISCVRRTARRRLWPCMQLVRSRKPMGPLELLGARGLGTLWSAAPATSTEEGLGQAPGVCRTARRRLWRAACEDQESQGPAGAVGATEPCALRARSAHRHV